MENRKLYAQKLGLTKTGHIIQPSFVHSLPSRELFFAPSQTLYAWYYRRTSDYPTTNGVEIDIPWEEKILDLPTSTTPGYATISDTAAYISLAGEYFVVISTNWDTADGSNEVKLRVNDLVRQTRTGQGGGAQLRYNYMGHLDVGDLVTVSAVTSVIGNIITNGALDNDEIFFSGVLLTPPQT